MKHISNVLLQLPWGLGVFSMLIVDFGVSIFALPRTFVSSESVTHRALALLVKSVDIHFTWVTP